MRWERNSVTELVRFENYFETDAAGHSLPYLEGIIGRTKEDQVRLLSTGWGGRSVDNMAYTDASSFPKVCREVPDLGIPTLGTAFLLFNLEKGPFRDKQLRLAAAHAIDHEAIKQAAFYGRGETAHRFYAPTSPWHMPGLRAWPAYDPTRPGPSCVERKPTGPPSSCKPPCLSPIYSTIAELVQAMWSEVGFKAMIHLYEDTVLYKKRRDRDFHADVTSSSYRWDPDGWFSRQLFSVRPTNSPDRGSTRRASIS